MRTTACAAGQPPARDHAIVNDEPMASEHRVLCGRCFKEAAAGRLGLVGFEHGGVEHEFRLRTRLLGAGLAIDALDFRDGEQGGHEFMRGRKGR